MSRTTELASSWHRLKTNVQSFVADVVGSRPNNKLQWRDQTSLNHCQWPLPGHVLSQQPWRNVLDVELEQLVLGAQPQDLRLGWVQLQSAWAQPGFSIVKTAEKSVDCRRSIVNWRAYVHLAVVSVLVQNKAVIRHHSTEGGRVQDKEQRA